MGLIDVIVDPRGVLTLHGGAAVHLSREGAAGTAFPDPVTAEVGATVGGQLPVRLAVELKAAFVGDDVGLIAVAGLRVAFDAVALDLGFASALEPEAYTLPILTLTFRL